MGALHKVSTIALLIALTTGCATSPRKRMFIGAGAGAGMGAVGGAILSPNSESRGLNTLIFGVIGALAGGLGALLMSQEDEIPEGKKPVPSLTEESAAGNEFITRPNQELPAFVKQRLIPVVVEELTENDTVGEDGTLHEPHKVYRIKRQAELIARPISGAQKEEKKK
jgi:hypothetical protein